MFIGEGDDGDFGDAIVPARDGQADAINGDGALGHDGVCERFRNLHAVPPVLAFGFKTGDTANCVHVTQNKMAAKLFAGGHGLFEIDAHPRPQFTEGGLANGFPGKIGGEAIVSHGDNREAATVHGDAVGDGQMRSDRGRVDGEPSAVRVELQGIDGAEMLDDAGEHKDLA